jgi:flagellar basal body P-ring formation protein FlgA
MNRLLRILPLILGLSGYVTASDQPVAQPVAATLRPETKVTGEGVFFEQCVTEGLSERIRLCDAPVFGQRLLLPRARIVTLLGEQQSGWILGGSDQVAVSRAARSLEEAELKAMLTAELQKSHVRHRGELEVRCLRAWTPIQVPAEVLTLKVVELPLAGITASFIVRFELRTEREVVGQWQMPLQAQIWNEVWVARSLLARGELLRDADLGKERRDVLTMREAVGASAELPDGIELASSLPQGVILMASHLRLRPLVRRGQVVEAVLQDGGLAVSLKVEALEQGAAGQVIRVRNLQSKREFRGKVANEETVHAIL